jgi:hypothetical protein
MIKKRGYILFFIFALIAADAIGQNSQIMYFMNLPQNHFLNPALRPSNRIYVGLPGLSGINVNVNNNYLNFSDIFIKGQVKDSIVTFLHPDYSPEKFLAKIKDINSMETETAVQLLGVGFSVGTDGYVFLDINERIQTNLVLPGDLFKLALYGNESFVGKTIDLSSLRADMKIYHEIGLGYSRNVTEKLRIGIKGKLLFGIAAASVENNSFGLTVNTDYTHTLDADLSVNMSGPVTVEQQTSAVNIKNIAFHSRDVFKTSDDTWDFLEGRQNLGLGLDIGATFDLTEQIFLSASVTDLGFIRWKKDLTNLKTDNQFKFSGLNMTDYFSGDKTLSEIGTDLADSLTNTFMLSNTRQPFTTYLPFGISLAGSYNINKSISVGLLSYTRVVGKQIREALTVSANLNISNAFSASLGYTAENQKYDNLGAGIAVRAGVAQFYLASDRIPIVWNKIIKDKSTIFLPANWNTINFRIGMNLVFGNKVKEKKDIPMVIMQ